PDILATLERPRPCVVVGFALEAGGDGVAKARQKLQDKALDFVILNDALEPGAGFEVATNRVTIIGKAGAPIELPLLSKRDVADKILDAVERALTSATGGHWRANSWNSRSCSAAIRSFYRHCREARCGMREAWRRSHPHRRRPQPRIPH